MASIRDIRVPCKVLCGRYATAELLNDKGASEGFYCRQHTQPALDALNIRERTIIRQARRGLLATPEEVLTGQDPWKAPQ